MLLRFEQALASIAAQDPTVAVVVVDNASRVPLPDLSEIPGVSVVRTVRPVSLGAARNLGLERVETEFVMFADADDLILAGTVAKLQLALESDPDMVACAMAFVDAQTGERHRWPRPWISRLVRHPRLLAWVNAAWAVYPITGPVLIRAAAARRVGGHADIDNGDARCLGAALLFAGRVGWMEAPGCVYHQRAGSNLDRFSGSAALLQSAGSVRERLRGDFGGPAWLPAVLPVLALAQWAAVGAHLVVAGLRRVACARAARVRR